MRVASFLTVLLVAPLLITGCWGPVNGTLDGGSASAGVPAESIDDELRSSDAPFEYDTLLPVVISIQVYLTDGGGGLLPGDASPVFVRLRDSKMNELLSGAADETGHFLATMPLPGAYEDISIAVRSPGFEEREFVVEEMVRYAVVRRTIVLQAEGGALGTNALSSLADTDGDGVPDLYDDYPTKKEVAFEKKPVGGEWLTIAYEDNFPEVGDGDFNDFIARYYAVEALSETRARVKVSGEVEAIARVAGYDHRFGILFGHPGYNSKFTVSQYDSHGGLVSQRSGTGNGYSNLIMFESTKGAFDRPPGVTVDNGYPDRLDSRGHSATFSISLFTKVKEPIKEVKETDTLKRIEEEKEKVKKKYLALEPPYDPYLYIYDTTYDVHLPGMSSLPDGVSNNPSDADGFLDEQGYPRGLLVPTNWGYPIEMRHIEVAYPDFALWRSSGGKTNTDWYLYPQKQHVIFIE